MLGETITSIAVVKVIQHAYISSAGFPPPVPFGYAVRIFFI